MTTFYLERSGGRFIVTWNNPDTGGAQELSCSHDRLEAIWRARKAYFGRCVVEDTFSVVDLT